MYIPSLLKALQSLTANVQYRKYHLGGMQVFRSLDEAKSYQISTSPEQISNRTTLKEVSGKFYRFNARSNVPCSGRGKVVELQKKLSNDFIDSGKIASQP